MSQSMARVRVCSGLTRYRSLRTLLTSTGRSSKRVLAGALQASFYSRSAASNVRVDAMFIETPPWSLARRRRVRCARYSFYFHGRIGAPIHQARSLLGSVTPQPCRSRRLVSTDDRDALDFDQHARIRETRDGDRRASRGGFAPYFGSDLVTPRRLPGSGE